MKRKIRCGGKPMTAIVLAGGRGRRMKADKAWLDVGGKTLLEHVLIQVEPYFHEVLISLSPNQDRARLRGAGKTRRGRKDSPSRGPSSGRRVVRDETPGLGPIGGLLAGLKAARSGACIVIACDIPEIPVPLLRSLARAAGGAEIAVPIDPEGHYEPLLAVYKRSVIGAIEALLARGEQSLLPLIKGCRTAIVPLGGKGGLRNLNTRADYESYLRSISRPAGRPIRRNGTARRPRPQA